MDNNLKVTNYYYCIGEQLPDDSSKRGCYIYSRENGSLVRTVLSPIFQNSLELKAWREGKFENDPHEYLGNNTWSQYNIWRLKKVDSINKKTQRIVINNLTPTKPKIVEIDISQEEIEKEKYRIYPLKDSYIRLMAGKLEDP